MRSLIFTLLSVFVIAFASQASAGSRYCAGSCDRYGNPVYHVPPAYDGRPTLENDYLYPPATVRPRVIAGWCTIVVINTGHTAAIARCAAIVSIAITARCAGITAATVSITAIAAMPVQHFTTGPNIAAMRLSGQDTDTVSAAASGCATI